MSAVTFSPRYSISLRLPCDASRFQRGRNPALLRVHLHLDLHHEPAAGSSAACVGGRGARRRAPAGHRLARSRRLDPKRSCRHTRRPRACRLSDVCHRRSSCHRLRLRLGPSRHLGSMSRLRPWSRRRLWTQSQHRFRLRLRCCRWRPSCPDLERRGLLHRCRSRPRVIRCH